MKKQLKPIPHFKDEQEEREFWQKVDSTQYVAYSSLKRFQFKKLKLSTKPITLRLPETLIEKVKLQAKKEDVPYQSLLKHYLHQAVFDKADGYKA